MFAKNPDHSRMCEAMQAAHAAGRCDKTAAQWAAEYGRSVSGVYRAVRDMGLAGLIKSIHNPRAEAVVSVSLDEWLSPRMYVPTTVLSRAGLAEYRTLKVRVIEPGKILVEAITP